MADFLTPHKRTSEDSTHELPPGIPAAVEVPMPPLMRVYQGAAFALSALLSPYLVIPVGTVGIVASQPVPPGQNARRSLLLWTSLSVFFSTIVPALFVVIQMLRGKITDVHVMEREQRGGPFLVAIFSSALGAGVLKYMGAPFPVWSVGLVLAINGIIMLWITSAWKISIHVSVLSATVLAGIMLIDGLPRWQLAALVCLVPALIWARITRGRHSIWQGIGGCGVASLVTFVVLGSLNYFYQLLARQS
jgi:hypothetical protein